MRIVITGANSAVGRAILMLGTPQSEPPVTLVAAVRSDRALSKLPPLPSGQSARIAYDDPASLRAAFTGAAAVIHLAGTLVERPDSTYEEANVQTTRAVVEAAEHSGVEKLVLVSAVGADAAASNRYWRTKGEAEALIRAGRCSHTILRAPLLLGPGTEGTAALLRHLSRPTVVLPGGGRNRQQPLHVDDLARAAILAAQPSVARNRTLDLVGPTSLLDRDILLQGAQVLGCAVRIRSMPIAALRLTLTLRRWLGRSGFSPDVLEVITADTDLDPLPAAAELGIQLTAVSEMISHGLRAPAQRGR